jgi:hypothetical protein
MQSLYVCQVKKDIEIKEYCSMRSNIHLLCKARNYAALENELEEILLDLF